MFFPVKIVKYQQRSRGHPRHGIADEYCRELMFSWNHQQDPWKTHDTHAAQSDQGREQYVADSTQCAGKDLNKNENNITRRNIPQHIDSDFHDIDVCREYMIQRSAEYHQEDQKGSAYTKGH